MDLIDSLDPTLEIQTTSHKVYKDISITCTCIIQNNKLVSTYSLTSGGFPSVKLPSTNGTHVNTKPN